MKNRKQRPADTHIDIMTGRNIASVPGPNIIEGIDHVVSKYLSDTPVSEFMEEIRAIRGGNEQKNEPQVYSMLRMFRHLSVRSTILDPHSMQFQDLLFPRTRNRIHV